MERRAFLAASTTRRWRNPAASPRLTRATRRRLLQAAPPCSWSCAGIGCATGRWPRASRPTRRTRSSRRSAARGSRRWGRGTSASAATARRSTCCVPHQDAESLLSLDARLGADAEYAKAAASFLALPPADPPFERCDSSLVAAVADAAGIEKPAGAMAAASRLYELRTYRSPSEPAGRRKIEMFEAGGELAIFRRLGFHVVFFGRDLVGSGLPVSQLHARVGGPGRARAGLARVPRRPRVAEAARPAAERRHRLRHRRERAARDRLLAGLILIKGGLRRPPLDPRSLRPSESGYVRSPLQTRPPGNSWAASEAGFISIE